MIEKSFSAIDTEPSVGRRKKRHHLSHRKVKEEGRLSGVIGATKQIDEAL